MEVEVKFRLHSKEDHTKASRLFGEEIEKCVQSNYYFDTIDGQLSKERVAFRLRLTNDKCILTLKEKTCIQGGVQRSLENEEEIEKSLGQQIVLSPNLLSTLGERIPLVNTLLARFPNSEFKLLTNFKNTRQTYRYLDHAIELDETEFPFGVAWEIEVESDHPDIIKHSIESLLKKSKVDYKYSTCNKLGNALNGKID